MYYTCGGRRLEGNITNSESKDQIWDTKVNAFLLLFYHTLRINECHVLVVVCALMCVKCQLITLLIPINYIVHFLHLNWLFITVDIENDACVLQGSKQLVNFLIAVLTLFPGRFSHIC